MGGAARDLLLRRPVTDVDLVVEGDGPAFAKALASRLGASLREHPRFGTATLRLPGGSGLDVASSRAETYPSPGALPRVEPGTLEEDLARRDFSVNAMALEMTREGPRWIDPHGGRRDLERRNLRMLHARSPHDDPTRSLRAVLYANRLGFRIDPATRRWIAEAEAEGGLSGISGDRLRREIARILSEPGRDRALALVSRLGLARKIHPALPADAPARARLRMAERRLEAASGAGWFPYLLVWAAPLDPEEAASLARRLNLPRSEARALCRWPGRARQTALGRDGTAATEAERLALSALRRRRPRRRSGEAAIAGRDLVAAGVAPGPAIGRALAATRAARAAGRIDPGEELAFALAAARKDTAG